MSAEESRNSPEEKHGAVEARENQHQSKMYKNQQTVRRNH